MATLSGNKVKDTYNKLVQVNGNNELQDGLGNLLTGSLGLSGSLVLSGSLSLGDISNVSSSINDLIQFSASLDNTYATDAELGAVSGAAHTQRGVLITDLSGSAHTQREAISSSFASTIAGLDASGYATDAELSAATSSLSSSAHIQREALNTALSSSAHTARRNEVSDLSGSSHTQREAISASLASSIGSNSSDVNTLSGSAHTQRVAISASLKGYTDSKIADLISGSPELLNTLDEIANAIGDDPAISASFATTLSTKASIAQLNSSGSTLQSNIDSLSGSAHTQRNYLINDISGSAHTQRTSIITSLSGSSHTQRAALDSEQTTALNNLSSSIESTLSTFNAPTATSASFATTASHALNVPESASYAISASYATTASFALNVSEGTGFPYTGSAIITGSLEVIGGVITGDGSGITNIALDAQSSHYQSFSSQTSVTVNHGLNSKNVIVTVYNNSDQQIIPAGVTTTDADNVTISFDSSTSGRVGVTRGGHIISASSLLTITPSDPLPSNVPTGSIAVSGSIAKLYFYNGNSVDGWKEIAFV